ncbi:phage major capsid protein [Acinetobacter sp. ANC 4470]|uniref:phage major capsid protein n=1 Tax=Acinetobacter sp. ANC 4470 TaxID=1977881 RepID=UPI000A342F66|nr:phage major capsid protein [Acinetobacter sp. ANC 4470]OTG64346.1 phage major capsid protein [Acinetobacter sp. ANC 4470]
MKFLKTDLAIALTGMTFTRDTSQTKPLPDFNKDKLVRNYVVDDFKVDIEKRTVELSFSSETEVGRWFGVEVLDHSQGAIDFSRLNTRAPFLMDHNSRDQVGVVESAWLDHSQRKGRALVRLSKSARGEEILQDIDDLIRTNISVGYTIKKAILKEQREHDDVYLITEWQPYEISCVSIPADTNVGVGRSAIVNNENNASNSQNENISNIQIPHQQRKQTMNWDYFTDKDGNQVRQRLNDKGERHGDIEMVRAVNDTAERGAEAERKRVSELMQLGERFGAGDLVRQYIDENKSSAELQNAILERVHGNQGKPITEQPKSNNANIGLTGDEARSFSLMRAVRAMLPNATLADREAAAFELECSEAAQKAYGRSAQGILVPADVLSRVFEVGTSQNGATLVGTDHRADMFIEMLRNRSTIMNLGFIMDGLVGDAEIPKQTGGATAYWLGEEEEVLGSSPATGQLKLSPKTVGGRVEISRKLMQQSSPAAEQLVWNDLNRALALKIDKAAYYGTGGDNQPLGLKNISGVNAVSFAAVNPNFAEMVAMESEIASDNADIDRMSYVINAVMRGHFKTAPRMGAGTESTIWEPGNTVNGYRTEVTNQIEAGDVFFGNFADLIIAMWGGLDITIDPYSLSSKGGLRIVGFQDVDFVLRNTESICYGKKTV